MKSPFKSKSNTSSYAVMSQSPAKATSSLKSTASSNSKTSLKSTTSSMSSKISSSIEKPELPKPPKVKLPKVQVPMTKTVKGLTIFGAVAGGAGLVSGINGLTNNAISNAMMGDSSGKSSSTKSILAAAPAQASAQAASLSQPAQGVQYGPENSPGAQLSNALAARDSTHLAKLVSNRAVNLRAPNPRTGSSPLHELICKGAGNPSNELIRCIKTLAEATSGGNGQYDRQGMLPIDVARTLSTERVVEILMNAGALVRSGAQQEAA